MIPGLKYGNPMPSVHGIKWVTYALLAGAFAGLVALSCGGSAPEPSAAADSRELLPVVTTTAILADLVRNVGGDRVEVRSIIPAGADIHSFSPTPQDSIEINNAMLIVSNGGGLDDFLDPVLKSAGSDGVLRLVTSEGLPIDQSRSDPHLWQNPEYTVHYIQRIRDSLVLADPAAGQVFRQNADSFIQAVRRMDQEIDAMLKNVPPERRHLVTFHNAFGHFALRYGWQASAFVLGDAGDVTPEAVVKVMERISEQEIPVVFAEPQFNSEVLRRVASDSQVGIGLIYSDVLDDRVPTYIDMMKFNAASLAENLR